MRLPVCSSGLALLLAACGGDDAPTDADAALAADAGPAIPICGGGELPDWFPVDGAAIVVSTALGVPPDTELWLEGAQHFHGPQVCIVQVPPGAYTVRYVAGGAELARIDLVLAARDVHVIGMLLHPTLGSQIAAVPWDFTPPADGRWRLQLANFTPESATTPLDIYAFPPGTPWNPVPPDAEPTLLGSIERGGQLTALLPPDTQMLSFLPRGSSYTPHQAPTWLLRDSCVAQMGAVVQIWCDSADPYDDVDGGPCDGLLGGHLWMHSLDGTRCRS